MRGEGRWIVSRDQVAEGAQVAQHGGETGEANDWCRLHGLALHPLFRSPTTRYPCGYLPTPPAPPRHPWKRCIYISIRSSFDPPRIYNHPPPRFPVIKDANRFHGTRGWKATFLFQRCSLADPLFPRMIKFIRSRKLELEGI